MEYSEKISLNKNGRGVWVIDPIMGCKSGLARNPNGCYSDCYSARMANIYGYDFSKIVLRKFENRQHLMSIVNEIKNIDFPFIRMGNSGDPSENWDHTLNICKTIYEYLQKGQLDLFNKISKEIVIITKHWKALNEHGCQILKDCKVCINTSISAIDKPSDIRKRLNQYNRLKKYCKSILRIVSFDFNKNNDIGLYYSKIQDDLFKNENIIDTVFRPSKNNPLVENNIINVRQEKFLNSTVLISKFRNNTYFGDCDNCLEMCGITME